MTRRQKGTALTSNIVTLDKTRKCGCTKYTDSSHTGKLTVSIKLSWSCDAGTKICRTYNMPVLNMKMTLNFFSNAKLSFNIVGNGSRSTIRSAEMLIATCGQPCAETRIFGHFPWCSPSQNIQAKSTGWHRRTQAMRNEIHAAQQKAIMTLTQLRKVKSGNNRR